MREQVARIQRISFDRSFDDCVALVGDFLDSLRETGDAPLAAPKRAPVGVSIDSFHMTSRFRSAFQLAIAIVLFGMVAILSREFYRWLQSAEANSADSAPDEHRACRNRRRPPVDGGAGSVEPLQVRTFSLVCGAGTAMVSPMQLLDEAAPMP